MGRRAKPLQDQVALLQKRGMLVHNPEKARQILLEIGWYRMSFYWFPFERRYPDVMNPTHEFRPQTTFEDALMLYAFDFNLRNALLKPLERIETAFRTFIIYHVSTRYPESPAWFADQHVVGKTQAQSFERVIYNPLKRNNPEIMLHHRRFPRDKFAPAWKTLEFMTLGTMCNLYESLANHNIKHDIARHFGVDSESIFENYMEVIRGLRNICAHGNVLYSYRPPKIRCSTQLKGAPSIPGNLRGGLHVVEFFLEVISQRLLKEFKEELADLVHTFSAAPGARRVLHEISGLHARGGEKLKGVEKNTK